MRKRIVGRKPNRKTRRVESAFRRVEIFSDRVAKVPAHDEVRPNSCRQQKQDQHDLDQWIANVYLDYFLRHWFAS